MKKILLALILVPSLSFGQKFISESSNIRFYSSAPIEDIEATTTTSKSVVDLGTGDVVFSVEIADFQFEKSLMQEHFNENYMESDKYPKSTFKGKIDDWSNSQGEQEVTVSGELTIHGIKQNVTLPGKINVGADKVTVESVFNVKLVDHKIKIPKAVFYNIAEVIEVTVNFSYKPYEK